jgi:hypothetical protein
MPKHKSYGCYEKTARVLVKEFLTARFPGDASWREMMAEIKERKLTQISVDDALLTLSASKEAEIVDSQAKFKRDWRWRAIPPAGRGDA